MWLAVGYTHPMAIPTPDQFAGSLIGQALGDALGFVVEGYPTADCRRYVDDVLRSGKAGSLGRGPFAFGQYTDDTQLARELASSYADCGRFEPADFARRIAAIFAEGRIVGRGRATEAAAMRLHQGVRWDEAGTPPPNAGNGSAMRAGPAGWMVPDDDQALVGTAVDQGRITHADPRSSAGAVAIAGAVAMALRGEVRPDHVIPRLANLAAPVEPSVAREIGNLAGWLTLAPEDAGPLIARAGLDPDQGDPWDGISPFVTSSVCWSLYSFLRSPEDYWQTICTAIAVGGDVDTTAAMAGAVSGAYLGLHALPADLARQLNDQGSWGYDELADLARRCHLVAYPARD